MWKKFKENIEQICWNVKLEITYWYLWISRLK